MWIVQVNDRWVVEGGANLLKFTIHDVAIAAGLRTPHSPEGTHSSIAILTTTPSARAASFDVLRGSISDNAPWERCRVGVSNSSCAV
jgi:hypothetical protein